MRIEQCDLGVPALRPVGPDHLVRCIRAQEVLTQERRRFGDPIEMPAAADMAAPRLDNVVAWYGRHEVVHAVSLPLAPHERLAPVGEAGAGKPTVTPPIARPPRKRQAKITP